MNKLVALFSLVAVAAAEPQYGRPYSGVYDPHTKTASGDTVSVQAAKVNHHQLKAAEYANKGYAPVYAAPSAVYSAPHAATSVPVYNHGVYSAGYIPTSHYLGKREAESDSQMVYTTAYGGYPSYQNSGYKNMYQAGLHGSAYPAMHTYSIGAQSVYPNTYYSGYTGHHLGKREADADSQVYQYTTGYPYANTYAGVNYANAYAGALNNYVYKAPVSTSTYGYTTPYNTYGNIWNGLHY